MYHCVRAKDLIMREIIVLMRDISSNLKRLKYIQVSDLYVHSCIYLLHYEESAERDKINDDNVNASIFQRLSR